MGELDLEPLTPNPSPREGEGNHNGFCLSPGGAAGSSQG